MLANKKFKEFFQKCSSVIKILRPTEIDPGFSIRILQVHALQMRAKGGYLVGKTYVQIDKVTLNRILEVSKFPDEDRQHVFSVIDAFIAKEKYKASCKKPGHT
jgi:hypothetical protein